MADQEINKPKKRSEKQFRKTIQEKLAAVLADLKTGMDEKEFQNSLKRASKLLSKDFFAAAAKKLKKEDKAAKKSKKKKEFLM